jgi:hypothetical protein
LLLRCIQRLARTCPRTWGDHETVTLRGREIGYKGVSLASSPRGAVSAVFREDNVTTKLGLFLAAVIAVSSVACSDSGSMSPAGPSGASGAQAAGPTTGVIEIEGDVSRLAGACPALTFSLGSQLVRTTSSTTFEHIKCSEVKNGIELEVYGRMQGDSSLTATGIQPEYY